MHRTPLGLFAFGLSILWASVSLWAQADSSGYAPAEAEPDPAETEWQPTYQYMELPPSATPLNGMLPFGGVGASPRLMKNNRGQVYSHDIDIATREMDVSEKRVNSLSRDTTTLWTAHYPELTDYVADMYDIGRKNLWLNGLVGQKDGGYETPETGSVSDLRLFSITSLTISIYAGVLFLVPAFLIQKPDLCQKSGWLSLFFKLSSHVAQGQPFSCPGKSYIKKTSFLFYSFFQHCFFIRHAVFIHIHNKYTVKLQAFDSVKGRQCYPFFFPVLFSCLLF